MRGAGGALYVKTPISLALRWSLVSLAVGLVLPSLIVFCLEVFVGGVDPMSALANVAGRQFAEGHNLFLIAAWGMIPFVVLAVVCLIVARWLPAARLACVAAGGLIGVVIPLVIGHGSVWYPLYGPGDMSSTAVIGLFFLPFIGLAALAAGLLSGWIISLAPWFRGRTGPGQLRG